MNNCNFETWKNIPFIQGYQVSDKGNIRSLRTLKLLKPSINSRGYCLISIKKKTYRVHRLIAITFIQKKSEYKNLDFKDLQVNHIDGIKTNNVVENLEWSTNSENQIHRYRILKKTNKRKHVYQLDINSNAVVFTYKSIYQAEKQNKFPRHTISNVCEGLTKSYVGYKWKYAE